MVNRRGLHSNSIIAPFIRNRIQCADLVENLKSATDRVETKNLKAKLELKLFGFQELLLDLNKFTSLQLSEFRSNHRCRWVTTAITAKPEIYVMRIAFAYTSVDLTAYKRL